MLPDVARWQAEHAERLLIVSISRGDLEANRARNAEHNLRRVLLQTDREVEQAYKVVATPTAVLIDDGTILSRLAEGFQEIQALVAQAVLPPPLKRGEPVPSLPLSDLDGKIVDLATLRGRRTLLLFWNPSCGFCQRMLKDLKKFEQNPPVDAPDLLVISQGTPEAIREDGFRSTVLVDQDSAAAKTFGTYATPTAVVVDEEGRLASAVGEGASAVLALAKPVPATNGRPA